MAIGAGSHKMAVAHYGEKDHIELEIIDTANLASVVTDRKQWKQELTRKGWMKILGEAKIVAKDGGAFSPSELLNECSHVFAHDQNGNLHELTLIG